jgi:hypothetical protein
MIDFDIAEACASAANGAAFGRFFRFLGGLIAPKAAAC